ncbi:MAG: hypothetical protein LAO08_01835 [Acidobacteriia bacterium]|nr:hypothetical protein [Terriglobia bacterium]
MSLLWALPLPVPRVHDEFSYLLAADTFAHGRLTNPTHPMWVFFDTIHVNQHPTYMSKYPPAQGAMLAVGMLLGNAWFGVVLSVGLMCAAILWMLQGWFPPGWALLGGILAMFRLGIFTGWMNTYWGGAVAAIGGALVVGAMPRIIRHWRARDALLLAFGVAILANSRPFEGLILCLPVMAVLLAWLFSKRSPSWRTTLPRIILPLCAAGVLCGTFMGYYNWRGTGSPALFPYVVNERTYISTPTLFWEKPRPPLDYSNPQLDAFYNVFARKVWFESRVDSVGSAARSLFSDLKSMAYFFMWPELLVPLVALPWLLWDHRIRFLIVQCGISLCGMVLVPWYQPHYTAPLAATLFALLTQAMRHLRQFRHGGRPVGIGLSRVVVLAVIFLSPHNVRFGPFGHRSLESIDYRAMFDRRLQHTPGEHLVIVRYDVTLEKEGNGPEWVYNAADIDHSKIVWAREIPGVDIRPLLDYFHGRHLWLAEPEAIPPRVTPYTESPAH